MDANNAEMLKLCGRTVLWVGNESHAWSTDQWRSVGQFAHSLGVDSVCAKVADGAIKWYGSPHQLLYNIRDVVLTTGCGFIPFDYCYGPKFGNAQIHAECAVLAEMMSVCPIVQADMEAEWNGHTSAATLFEQLMRPVPGALSVSTWADPAEQQWEGVAHILAPCVNQWVIQQYTNWLAAQEGEYDKTVFSCIAPGVDLRPEFGADDPVAIAKKAKADGHQTVFIWEYESARANPNTVREIVAVMAG